MRLQDIKSRLKSKAIFFSEDSINNKPTVVGYEKKFKWKWMATQMNTFIIASDFGDETITDPIIEGFLDESFKYTKANYSGWPQGLQSGLAVIAILVSKNINDDAIEYCTKLKPRKKWAGFPIPVTIDSTTDKVYSFDKNPIWGRIYYPYFRQLVQELT